LAAEVLNNATVVNVHARSSLLFEQVKAWKVVADNEALLEYQVGLRSHESMTIFSLTGAAFGFLLTVLSSIKVYVSIKKTREMQ